MIESKQGISWGVLFATLVPATVCFAMRMQSRHLTKVHLWWDDYMAIAGYVSRGHSTMTRYLARL